MKFVALALALLLAVGSRAASLQADAPSQLEHVRAAADMYVTQLKESAKKALGGLDGTEYTELQANLINRIDEMHAQLKALQAQVSPMTDSVVSTVADATADLRMSIMADFQALKAELEPKQAKLKEVLDKHIQDYYAQLEPIVSEYSAKHTQEMEVLKSKMMPVVESLRSKVAINVDETKDALTPIVDTVRSKVAERLDSVKTMLSPYVQEYKDQLTQAYSQAQGINSEQVSALREKIAPMAEDIKGKLQELFAAIYAAVSKN